MYLQTIKQLAALEPRSKVFVVTSSCKIVTVFAFQVQENWLSMFDCYDDAGEAAKTNDELFKKKRNEK